MKKIWTQQQRNNLESLITLDCDLNVNGNIVPAETLDFKVGKEEYTLSDIIKIVCSRQFKKDPKRIRLSDYCLIKTKAMFNFISDAHRDRFRFSSGLFGEYTRFKDNFINKDPMPPIVLTHPGVLEYLLEIEIPEELYQIDGMRRIMSALWAEVYELPALVLTRRDYLKYLVDEEIIEKITKKRNESKWFPDYQEIIELGIEGERTYEPRFTEIYDFSILKGTTVVDFGGNTGQSAIEAHFCGAKKIYNFDCQPSVVETCQQISNVLGADIISKTIDFNSPTFQEETTAIVPEWDWAIFQAIYRTKEIEDIESVFDFVVKNSKIGIMFEGNSKPEIDTDDFYQNVFKKYNFKEIKYLGHSNLRPGYLLIKEPAIS